MTNEQSPAATTGARRVPAWAISAIAVGSLATVVTAGLAFVTAKFSRSVVIPTDSAEETLRVHAVHAVDLDARTVTLGVSADSLVPGRYSLWFDGGRGHARIGDIVHVGEGRVIRSLERVDHGRLQDARWGRLGSWYYLDPRELGLPVEDVTVDTELGAAPAWLVRPDPANRRSAGNRWVIAVHGRGVRRAETIRPLPLLHELGFTTLQVSYRNDGEAPRSSDGRYALGDTEWHDVDAGIRYAIEHGAERIVLFGWSMGGATVLQAATRSEFAPFVEAVILDSPVVAWSDTIVFQGHLNHLPEPISQAVMATIGNAVGKVVTGQQEPIDFKRLDFVARASEISFPVLILHSDDDGFVPSTASRKLAEARPDVVTLVPFSIAKHVRLWNYDPDRYLGAIRTWLTARNL